MKSPDSTIIADLIFTGDFIQIRNACPEWKGFIQSVFCPFNEQERKAFAIFSNPSLFLNKAEAYDRIAESLNVLEEEAGEALCSGLKKLDYIEDDYKQWLRFRSLACSHKKMKQHDFHGLMPLRLFTFSDNTLDILKRAGCNCLEDVLLFKKKELLKLEGFGEKELEEVNKVLSEIELLKKKGS